MSDVRRVERGEVQDRPSINLLDIYGEQSFSPGDATAKRFTSTALDFLPKYEVGNSIVSSTSTEYGQIKVDIAGKARLSIDGRQVFSYGPSDGKETFTWSGDKLESITFADRTALKYDAASQSWQMYTAMGMPLMVKGKVQKGSGHDATFSDGPFQRTVTISGDVTVKKLYDQFTQFKQDTEKAKQFLTPEQREDLFKLETINESSEKCAYFCSKGYPTVGIGFMLERPDARAKIERLGIDYDLLVKSAPKNYKGPKPELNDEQIKVLFDGDISQTVIEAQSIYANFEKMPKSVQIVAVDLTFNMGAAKLQEFSTFNSFMRSGNFAAAANALERTAYYDQVGDRAKRNVAALRQNR